ncbi:MAG: type II secretion system protein [Victivallaceae bacterium]|nr:type II secretion system protein [Victivallaceae bacterium]
MRSGIRRFTLLEVVIALTIFAVGIGIAFGVSAAARMRTMKGRQLLEESHMLAQAVEYYLLDYDAEELPEDVFPYPEYHANVSYSDPDPESLPDRADGELGMWKLRVMRVELFNSKEESCGFLEMERIMPAGK